VRTTFVIAGGYTAGHITPGLALIEALRSARPEIEVLFVGANHGIDRKLVTAAGVDFQGLPAFPFARQRLGGRIFSLLALMPAIVRARRVLRERNAVSVIGLGSFGSVAPGWAARSLRIPLSIFEPNAEMGVANRALYPFSKHRFVSRLLSTHSHPADPATVQTGVPLRRSVSQHLRPRTRPDRHVNLAVLGGSLGDPFLNRQTPSLLRELARRGFELSVVHQCGHDVNPGPIRAAYAEAGVVARVEPFADPILPVLAAADVAITAAGAITLHELAALGVPALVVPLSGAAAGHQLANARAFEAATGCPVLPESSCTPAAVGDALGAMLRDSAAWDATGRRLKEFAPLDAAERCLAQIFRRNPEAH